MAFKDNLCYFRTKMGLTQEELADKVGVARSIVTRYELGDRTPPLATLTRLAKIFDCSLDDLVYGPKIGVDLSAAKK